MNFLVIFAILAAFSVNVAYSRRRSVKRQEPCFFGDGSSYRGYVSMSAYGHNCLNWNRFPNRWGASNPDQSLKPWCYVRRGKNNVKEFCSIPKCSAPTTKLSPAVDTAELTCGERPEKRMHKIVGGSFTAIESHPWVAAIFQHYDFLCGGSLIAPCWVLTAAHCFLERQTRKIQDLFVYLGKNAINDTDVEREQRFQVEKLIIHQKFNDSNFDNDIALLKIRSRAGGCAVRSASVRTVCLPPFRTQLPPKFQCSIAGYGKERNGAWQFSQRLKQAEVRLLSQTDCRSKLHYGDQITENMICAGSPDWSTDACKGDSGGPMVCELSGRMFLFGVVSWGDGCAKKNKPGVYTQVTNYNKWIAEKAKLSKFTKGLMYPPK
uniref:plasminogen activator, urokinase a n=1 Tax=Monopterus albus TaxID=43700 RepID=UPI0009B395EC|nr:urokinase-type plasminogen activator-like [Monopterus albus]